jgi:hypothetical protein
MMVRIRRRGSMIGRAGEMGPSRKNREGEDLTNVQCSIPNSHPKEQPALLGFCSDEN